jgi:hypothetical protein
VGKDAEVGFAVLGHRDYRFQRVRNEHTSGHHGRLRC